MANTKQSSTAALKIVKKKKTLSGPTAVFSIFNSQQNSLTEDSIEFDWSAEKRRELVLKHAFGLKANDPAFEVSSYTVEEWVKDVLFCQGRLYHDDLSDEEVARHFEKVEAAQKVFFYKKLTVSNGFPVGAHPPELVPYPLSYDGVALKADRLSHELLKKIYYGFPSIHRMPFLGSPPKRVLDLGCGDGSWIIDAAQIWKDTSFYGIDVQQLHPTKEQLTQKYGDKIAQNIKFTYLNFLSDKLPYLNGVFDMVRLANLKWCIPENRWDDMIQDVYRITARAGLVEIIDDDFVALTDPESRMSDADISACTALEAQFTEVLHARKIPLDTHEFMLDKLKKSFISVHQDVIPIAISPEREVKSSQVPKIPNRKPKIASILKRHSGSTSTESVGGAADSDRDHTASRSRSNSDSSSNQDEQQGEMERPLPAKPRPVGLVVIDRFLPCTTDEILTHATKGMQGVLSARETARDYLVYRNPALKSHMDELPSEEHHKYKTVHESFKKANQEFEDLFWTYERTMFDRLNINIPQCTFDLEDDTMVGEEPSSQVEQVDDQDEIRPVSTISQIQKGEFFWDGDQEYIAQELARNYNLDKLIRIIRIYTMWK